MIWFTGDTHLGHANIIKYCRRPRTKTAEIEGRDRTVPDVKAHDAALVGNWNSKVAPDDEVWHLGDFAWWHLPDEEIRALYDSLNGYKHLIIGNHDCGPDGEPVPILRELFGDRLHRYIEIKIGGDGRRKPLSHSGGQKLVLFHYAMRGWVHDYHNPDKGKKGSWHLYGHHHGRLMSHRTSFDVGVDVCNYSPISWPDVEQKMLAILAASHRGDPI